MNVYIHECVLWHRKTLNKISSNNRTIIIVYITVGLKLTFVDDLGSMGLCVGVTVKNGIISSFSGDDTQKGAEG